MGWIREIASARQRHTSSALLVVVSFGGGLTLLATVLEQRPTGLGLLVDVVAGFVASLLLLGRRRFPVPVAVCLAAAAAFWATAGVANYLALFTVARYRELTSATVVAVLNVIAAVTFWFMHPRNGSLSLTVVVNVAIAAAVVAWGALQQAQQDLVEVYRDRAARIEREQDLRAEQIQLAERTRIARDMHDSVAHHITLIALYAGGLQVQKALDRDGVEAAATTIRDSATSALDELRTAIGLLREAPNVRTEQAIDVLVESARGAGQEVVTDIDADAAHHPELYHLVREGLTNARKHAPHSVVALHIRRTKSDIVFQMTNPVDPTATPAASSGTGLDGLAERAAAAGGSVTHTRTADGDFRLEGRLPWS